ncbi:MAG: TIR domain-containing protein [Saprospiraceae bacterium]
MKSQKAIFISHAWGGISDEILAELTKTLEQEDIQFILDKRDLAYRQSINNFMVELGKADMVIIILSNKYLKSEYCMFELIQIYRNDNLRDRIFPIVLDEVKISSSADRLEFVKFWEGQLENLQKKVKELNSLSYIEGITDDLNLYAEIRNNIARLTGILRDINTLNVTIHVESDYRDLIQSIKRKISGESDKEENKIYISSTKPPSPVFNAFNFKLAGVSLLVIFALFVTWKILSKPKSLDDESMLSQKEPVFVIDSSRIERSNHDVTGKNGTNEPEVTYAEETQKIINQSNNVIPPVVDKSTAQKDYSTSTKTQTPVEKKVVEKYTPPNFPKDAIVTRQETKPVTKPEPKEEQKLHPIEDKPQVISIPTNTEPARVNKGTHAFTVPKGTSLLARSSITLSSDDELPVPRRVNFVLDQDVYDGKNVAIPAGSSVVGTLSSVKTSDHKRSGSVTLFFNYLVAPDGQKIPLQKEEMYLVASGKMPYEIHPNSKIKIKTSSSIQIRY